MTSTPAPRIVLRAESLVSDVARALFAELNAELAAAYPEPGANHFEIDADEVGPDRGVFLVAYDVADAARPIGCGAIRCLDAATAEVKRMYVAKAHRGRGVARTLLTALEDHARALGRSRLVLETGDRHTEAIALYERTGFARIPRFGAYVDSPLSVCMEKVIPSRP